MTNLFEIKFYNKLIENFKTDNKNYKNNNILNYNLTSPVNQKLKLIKDERNKNKYFIDRIFLHYNLNRFARSDSKLNNIENIFSKNLVIFNYGDYNNHSKITNFSLFDLFNFDKFIKLEENKKNLVVRLSVWAKISNNLIVEDYFNTNKNNIPELNKIYEYKIHDDEWHHFLLEFEDNTQSLRYLDIMKYYSFPRIIYNLIKGSNKEGDDDADKKKELKFNLKFADFDFYMLGNPISESEINFNKNELYYIRNRI